MSNERFSIKVMKLPRPNQMGNARNMVTGFKRSTLSPSHLSIGSDLTLVSNTECYLGETVRLLVRVSHNSNIPIRDTGTKIEVQTASGKKVVLQDQTSPGQRTLLAPEQSQSYVLDYKLDEVGPCSVVCSIFFLDDGPNGPVKKTIKKFWSFQVSKPFEISSNIHLREAIVLAEIKLRSQMEHPVFVEAIKLTGDQISFEDLQYDDKNSEAQGGVSVFGEASAMRFKECRSLLYRVHKSEAMQRMDQKVLRNIRMNIVWRSRMGQRGEIVEFLDSKNIVSKTELKEFDMVLIDAPPKALLEEPFPITLLVTSRSRSLIELRLEMRKEKSVSIFPCGLSNRSLGVFEPGTSKEVTIDLLPLNPGVQAISGFRLSCTGKDRHLDFDQLHEVEVIT